MQIARKLVQLRTQRVGLSGGEPLLIPGWQDIVSTLADSGIYTSMATNGSLLKEYHSDIASSGLRSLIISIDGSQREHDISRGYSGLFAAVGEGLDSLKKSDQKKGVHLGVRISVSPATLDNLEALVAYWHQRVDTVLLQPIHTPDPTHIHRARKEDLFPPEDREKFEAVLSSLGANYPEFRRPYYQKMADFIFLPHESKNNFKCFVPTLAIKVRPDGSVMHCANSSTALGNILEDKWKIWWNNDRIRELRRNCWHKQRSCFCWITPTSINYALPFVNR